MFRLRGRGLLIAVSFSVRASVHVSVLTVFFPGAHLLVAGLLGIRSVTGLLHCCTRQVWDPHAPILDPVVYYACNGSGFCNFC